MPKAPLSNPRIGLIAPAGPPLDQERLHRGIRHLERLGLRLVRPRQEYPTHGYLAGTDQARLDELHAVMDDPGLDVIFCVRGGYGTLRLLGGIDYELAARRPRTLVGYSDVTALQLALYARAGWTGLSAAMVGVEWPDPQAAWADPFWNVLAAGGGVELSPVDSSAPEVMVTGQVEGPLLGGNLAMVTRLLGTPYCPDFTGAILFLEDVGEAPYRLDGMLAHLKLAGVLPRLGGVILGAFTDADPAPNRPSFSVADVVADYFGSAEYPVVSGWNYGHFPAKTPMPIGVRARLSASPEGVLLETLEPVVRSGTVS